MVGSNRILPAQKIVNPLGNTDLPFEEEKRLRRSIVEKALEALRTEARDEQVTECGHLGACQPVGEDQKA
jgi:glycine reductase complex component B subunit gamma